jgi:hypothetical protein
MVYGPLYQTIAQVSAALVGVIHVYICEHSLRTLPNFSQSHSCTAILAVALEALLWRKRARKVFGVK